MLDTLSRLQLCVDLSRGGSCDVQLAYGLRVLVTRELDKPAAAAASTGLFLVSGVALSAPLLRGLRSRALSGLRAAGERDLRSNLERRGSGSVWSKRDRFAVRRSVSSIIAVVRLELMQLGRRYAKDTWCVGRVRRRQFSSSYSGWNRAGWRWRRCCI